MKDRIFNSNFNRICITNIVLQSSNQLAITVLPLVIQARGLEPSLLGTATALSAFISLLMRPVGGVLVDRVGRRFTAMLGICILASGMLGLAWIPFTAAIVIIRGLQGAGYSMASTAHYAVATDVLPPARVQRGLSYFGVCGTIAASAGPALGLAVVTGSDYTPSWLAAAAILLVGIVLTMTFTYERTMLHKQERKPQKMGLWDFLDKDAILPSTVQVVLMVASSGMLVFLPTYAVELGIPNMSLFYTFQSVSMLAANLLVSWTLPRMRSAMPLLLPAVLCFAGSCAVLWVAQGEMLLYTAGLLCGLGLGVSSTVLSVLVMSRAALERRGAASATYQCAGDLGYTIGSLVWGFVASAVGYRSLYGILIVLPMIALVMCLLIFRTPRKA